ncbi:MAG TPA: polysaccharide deacetylase family protein [Gammaproteobacteria bacterium]
MEFVTAKGVIKALISPVVDMFGIYDALLARRVFGKSNWLILMYHRIINQPSEDPFRLGMCVDRAHFAEQLDFLTQRFTPITVEDAVQRIRHGRPLPRNTLSVTFDDGYRDFVNLAMPVLGRYNCPATIYVSTGGIQENRHFWWDRVIASFANTRSKHLDLEIPDVRGHSDSLHLGFSGRRRALLRTLDMLWDQPAAQIDPLVSLIEAVLGAPENCLGAERLTLEKISLLDQDAVEIAVHCDAHADLTRMQPDEVLRDIAKSRRCLEEAAGRRLQGFAYPGGRQNNPVRQIVSRAGFSYAAGTEKGLNRKPFEAFNLRRIGMPNTSIADFKRCLSVAAGGEARTVSGESVQWP